MAAYTRHQSALGLALNGKSASVDIPKSRDAGSPPGRDNLTVVSIGVSKRSAITNLPSPPSSISPNLAPHGSQGPVSPTASGHQESDSDLQDAPHSALNAEALDRLGDLESAGAITPGMLSRQYLPDILLANGPLAIRHIMGYLTTSLPGFSRITSAKARRLVVAALEGRGSGSEGAGLDGDVIFEKVGWGRWDARKTGQPPRQNQGHMTPPGSLPSSYSQGAMQVPDRRSWRQSSDNFGTSFATSTGFSHSDEYHDVLEHEVDKMSMDGDDDGYQSSEAPPEAMDVEMDEGDVTDEEDWQSIGAEALRARSLPPGSLPTLGNMSGGGRLYQPISTYSTLPYSTAPRYRSKTPAQLAQSVPTRAIPVQRSGYKFTSTINDSQERAAVEALLSLGSM